MACSAGAGSQGTPSNVLRQSWEAYRTRFIQKDGRVIDYRAGGISTSEGQAYAMLRAAWIRDRATFDRAWNWSLNNLNSGVRADHLWAWKWGKDAAGNWKVLDKAFATDADEDAAVALLLAWKTWNDPRYLRAAQATIADLWNHAVVAIGGRRYLLAGDSLCGADGCRINPSYYAPYAYRLFAKYDRAHPWNQMVGESYRLLESVSSLTGTHLPPDWAHLDTTTGDVALGSSKDSSFSYDAFRVFWRVALDYRVNQDPRAAQYLRQSLPWLSAEWSRDGRVPAVISANGRQRAEYESFDMLGGILPALRITAPQVADQVGKKLVSTYSNGFWSEPDSYYLQNWAWLGTALYEGYVAPFRELL
ncbi:MAG: glycosyl hydrolase [Acidobacteria bacterium]|nr:glycosyl hydrolase [Acidobacteriota bacterium]